MFNLLVVEDNIYFSKILINKIIQSNKEIRLCTIATDGDEALDIIKKEKIDIVLLDLNLPKCNGMEILDFIQKNKKEEYLKSVIVVSGVIDMIKEIIGNPIIYSYILKDQVMDNVVQQVNEVIKDKIFYKKDTSQLIEKGDVISKINEKLINLGYNFKYIGTGYLVDTIYLMYCYSNKKNIKLERDIYPIIANMNNTTVNTIKCDIIKATKKVEKTIEEKEIMKFFGYHIDKNIKPKLVMNSILRKLKEEM